MSATLELGDGPAREPLFDPTPPLRPSGNLRRRELVSKLAAGAAIAAALLAIAVLAVVIYTVARRGLSSISFAFITQAPSLTGSGGGIAPELVGTIIIVALATAIAAPIGILTALFVTEFAGSRLAGVIRAVLDLMQGLPSIIVGVVVYGLLVVGSGQSGYAASVALAIIMLPLVARASQEVILLVPNSLREAADALGVNRWRTIWGVVLPEARAGIVTGTLLAVARAAGETAPLILICSVFNPNAFSLDPFAANHALPNVPVYIFTLSEQADPTSFATAWGAALVLLTMILIANIGARFLFARSARRTGR
jgi:phosphate transport system permease protein